MNNLKKLFSFKILFTILIVSMIVVIATNKDYKLFVYFMFITTFIILLKIRITNNKKTINKEQHYDYYIAKNIEAFIESFLFSTIYLIGFFKDILNEKHLIIVILAFALTYGLAVYDRKQRYKEIADDIEHKRV